ncbi:hypothetical protein BDK51DRAFT_27276, partial [Blyttiomyces helicus]
MSNPIYVSLTCWILKGKQSPRQSLPLIRSRMTIELALHKGYIDLKVFVATGSKNKMRQKMTCFLKPISRLTQSLVLWKCFFLSVQEASSRMNTALNITVSSARKNEVPHLLSYLTAPNFIIRRRKLHDPITQFSLCRSGCAEASLNPSPKAVIYEDKLITELGIYEGMTDPELLLVWCLANYPPSGIKSGFDSPSLNGDSQ